MREKGSFMWQVVIVYGSTDFKIFRLGLRKRSDTSFILHKQPFSRKTDGEREREGLHS